MRNATKAGAYLGAEFLEQATGNLVGAVVLANLLAEKERLVVLLHHLGNAGVERVAHVHLARGKKGGGGGGGGGQSEWTGK